MTHLDVTKEEEAAVINHRSLLFPLRFSLYCLFSPFEFFSLVLDQNDEQCNFSTTSSLWCTERTPRATLHLVHICSVGVYTFDIWWSVKKKHLLMSSMATMGCVCRVEGKGWLPNSVEFKEKRSMAVSLEN